MKIAWGTIVDALMDFDLTSKPAGLYAPEEGRPGQHAGGRPQTNWNAILGPILKKLGCIRTVSRRDGRLDFVAPDRHAGSLQVVRCSKIKVRKYGDTYRVDPHVEFATRWKEANLAAKINALRRKNWERAMPSNYKLLLFVGFSAEDEPFKLEMKALETDTGWSKEPLQFFSRIWPDPYGRHFNSYIALWVYQPEQS